MINLIEKLKPVVVLEHQCQLGEGPVWDFEKRIIIWIDILKGEIHEHSPVEKWHRVLPVREMIGSVALCKDGDFIAALQSGFAFINRSSGEIKKIIDPEEHLSGNRFNEGKCDPARRFFAGTMSLSKQQKQGSFYMLKADGSVEKKLENLSVPNGMAWSLDHQTFYQIDSPISEVRSYDYDIGTGNFSNKKVIINIPKEDGVPDGMTIDNEGMLWIAHWNGWQISRWNPHTGRKLGSVSLPVANVTSCTFGGDELNDLYITSARAGLTETELNEQPLAGSVFVLKNSGYKGEEAFVFNRHQ
ncbi:SMP-30/gluconolactonase/LRE family protein [Flavisolibacter ginsenosidimutans]|uniref:SMP-30/gluconolactonase/LRE family protein n=1 Tax=Flavisolibacter ginsenosidimutans TaxID=661481 RepID=UPI001D14AFFC|nr:SMP-30/gluconolactonase/LRE family protein [Flavisolibacter ginsenosidimutans]